MFTNPLEVAIVSSLITLLGIIIWWWFRRVVSSLDHSAVKQQELAISLAKICGTMTSIVQWQEYHEKTDAERHANQVSALEQLVRKVEGEHSEIKRRMAAISAGKYEHTERGEDVPHY